jgi:hypothetical protein
MKSRTSMYSHFGLPSTDAAQPSVAMVIACVGECRKAIPLNSFSRPDQPNKSAGFLSLWTFRRFALDHANESSEARAVRRCSSPPCMFHSQRIFGTNLLQIIHLRVWTEKNLFFNRWFWPVKDRAWTGRVLGSPECRLRSSRLTRVGEQAKLGRPEAPANRRAVLIGIAKELLAIAVLTG